MFPFLRCLGGGGGGGGGSVNCLAVDLKGSGSQGISVDVHARMLFYCCTTYHLERTGAYWVMKTKNRIG